MNPTMTLDETIEVDRPLHEVFAYIAEFSRIEEWDPAVARASRLTEGPLGVGSEFLVEMTSGLELHYAVTEWQQDARLLMAVRAKWFTAVEEIQFRVVGRRTQVRYIANFSFNRPLTWALKKFPGVMDRVGKDAVAGMKRALEDNFPVPLATTGSMLADKLLLPGVFRFTRFGHSRSRSSRNPVSAYLRDRHILITGATSGLGLATAEVLAARGAELTLVARDARKAEGVVRDLKRRFGNPRIEIEIADLCLMADVHALTQRLLDRGRPIDVLINNAGALINPREETPEGIEKSFALLLLGPYRLTEGLLPLLRQSGRGAAPARVVNVLSGGMYFEKVAVDDLESKRAPYSGATAYARAKRGLMILTEEWSKRWAAEGIVVHAMHPGWADTPGVATALPEFHFVTSAVLRTPQEGADTIVWLATATEAGKTTGQFWLDRLPHATHLLPGTRETPQERATLLTALADYSLAAAKDPSGKQATN